MQDCLFCKIAKGEIHSHKVYEDDDVFAFLDINPVNPGHTLVVPKEHHDDLLDTPPELQAKLIQASARIAQAIVKEVGADGFNIGINNGVGAGQIIFHTHFHIMPRLASDDHSLWQGKGSDEDELKRTAERISDNL